MRPMRFHTVISLFFFLSVFNPPTLQCSEKGRIDIDGVVADFDSQVSEFMEEQQAPGAAIAIVVDGRTVLLKGYGVTKVGGTDLIDIQTSFRIASLSKSFAAVLTGKLVEDGLLGWDDNVTTYLLYVPKCDVQPYQPGHRSGSQTEVRRSAAGPPDSSLGHGRCNFQAARVGGYRELCVSAYKKEWEMDTDNCQ